MNSIYDVIIKTLVTVVITVSLTCVCVNLYTISDTLREIRDCERQKIEYPTLKNIEVMNERIDSLMYELGF